MRTVALLRTAGVAAALAALACGCGTQPADLAPGGASASGTVSVSLPWGAEASARDAIPAEVETIVISIEAGDMAPVQATLTQADVQGGKATKTFKVVVGTGRVAYAQAFDANDQVIGRGTSAAFEIRANETTQVAMTLARVVTGSAIETHIGLDVTASLADIEAELKSQTAYCADVTRDADKVWCRFIGSRHLAYLYGSGRLFIVSSRNLSGLDGIWWLEDDLSWFLDRVQAASALDDASKWAARGCLTAVYSQQTGAYVRTRIVPTSFAQFDGRLRVPDPAPSAARAVLDSLDQGGALLCFDVAGSSLSWRGAQRTYSRVYAQLAPTAGDHGTYVRNYERRRARVYIEAFFPSGLTADDDFTLISDNGACGIETLVSKHMSELVLGP